MKKIIYTYFTPLIVCCLLCCCTKQQKNTVDFTEVEKNFKDIPADIQTSIYWYWINDNISKEAVIKDLHSMKEVGINRAFIGNIGLSPQEAPYGKVKIFTDEWWDIMHTALKTATELNIEIGLFNSSGWSQSGGPWIKPEQAMRYLTYSEVKVKGPKKLQQHLTEPTKDFQDVKVIAMPVNKDYLINLLEKGTYTISPSNIKADLNTGKELTFNDKEITIDITLPKEATARSLVLYPAERPIRAKIELQVQEGDSFKNIKQFTLNRTNPALNVGFEPYAPVAISLPEVKDQKLRLVMEANPGSGIKRILLSPSPVMERFAEKSLAKMHQTPLPYWHDYLWDEQPDVTSYKMAQPNEILDISGYMDDQGLLTWDVPEGEWIIMRTGMTPTGVTNSPASPEGTGLEVDKMSKEHVASHFDAYLGMILERIPADDRKTLKVAVQDSYETGGQNFTDDFLKEFQKRYGYDPVPFLPVFKGHIIGSPDLSDRFLWDVRRFVADKISYDYVGGLRKISHEHGMTTWLENYGHWGFPGEFLQYGGQSDEVGGEFWNEGNLGSIENRAASSCAHIYGKPKVSAESFTCGEGSYSRYPAILKQRGDWSFTEGVNNTLLHVYIHQPYENRPPGVNTSFGNEFNRLNTWYSHLGLFVSYIKRANYMLQQGQNIADVAYFIGEDAPKMTGIRDPEIPKGYSYDYINAEVIERDLTVKDGKLVLPHGTSYRVLVLPKLETMRPSVLKKIEQLVADGAVILGPPPSRSPSMENYPVADQEVNALAKKMWGDLSVKQRSYGKGTIYTDVELKEVLDRSGVIPDCQFGENDPVLYVHRTAGDNEIYFITNQSDRTITVSPQFRVQGKVPELWDVVTGSIRPLPAFIQGKESTTVPLQLEAYESGFIVFRKTGKPAATGVEDNYPKPEIITKIDQPWQVLFESDQYKRGPAQPVTFTTLTDWSKHEDESIRYYSGTAIYKTTFDVKKKPEGKLFVDLGQVTAMAKIKINGKYVGGVWTAPYRIEVSDVIRDGINELEVEVVNTWMNRLIGDLHLPEAERPTWAHHNSWNVHSPLQTSGLLGPVNLLSIKYK
ncbi:glycoside hydrolase family 2 [Parabacteroides faecis]|uniref:glycosyl hydrolase n=1 Tax=Parabacteroides TaxID=375288 RepID=UPI000EFDDB7D|nr:MULTISPECIES: glycosyl hydrolase [Parabacteroides]MBC8616985.1 glycoside hydrolase family 2 [Parabacteroides faecis]RHR98033.1 glycoside hydrolase family 2 [Parabacteroides sp. AF14-59]